MGLQGTAAIVGIAELKPEKKPSGPELFSIEQWAQLARLALLDAGLAPCEVNGLVTTAEDATYAFAAGDFNFSDPDAGDVLEAVEITTLPTVGTLYLDLDDDNTNDGGAETLTSGNTVSVANVDAAAENRGGSR